MSLGDAEQGPPEAPKRQGDRTVWYIVGGLVVLWLGYLALFGPRGFEGDLAPPALSDPGLGQADFSWALETLDGEPVDLARYRGRPIVLNLWATWCGPCLMEIPSLRSLAENPELDDLAVLAVSWEERADLSRVTEGEDSPLTFLRSPDFPPSMYLTDAIPATFVIAPSGRVAAMHVGAAQWDHPAVVAFLRGLEGPTTAAQAVGGQPVAVTRR